MSITKINKKAFEYDETIFVNVSGWDVMVEYIGRRGYRVSIDLPIEPDDSDKTVTLSHSTVFMSLVSVKAHVKSTIKDAPIKAAKVLEIANKYDFGYLSLDQLMTLVSRET